MEVLPAAQVRAPPMAPSTTIYVWGPNRQPYIPQPTNAFGLKSAPATFQWTTEEILKGLSSAKVYVDDILIYSPDIETHLQHLDIVLLGSGMYL